MIAFAELMERMKERDARVIWHKRVIWIVLRRMKWFRSGLPIFVLIVRAQIPYQIQVVQMRSLHQK